MNINDIVQYSLANNEFYKCYYAQNLGHDVNIKPLSFEELPIVTKGDFQNAKELLLSVPYSSYPQCDNVVIMRSSGSTGEYLKIFWDRTDRMMSLHDSWSWRNSNYGISPKDKMVDFYSTRYINNQFLDVVDDIIEVDSRHSSLSKRGLNRSRIDKYLDYIDCFQPRWLHIQPSILTLFYERLNETHRNLPSALRYIESTGEHLAHSIASYISQQLDIVIANFYGCNEVNYIACECPSGNMHVLDKNVYVEIFKNGKKCIDGEEGDIIVTGLHNRAMPIIRYNTGDTGKILLNHMCPCGCKTPILKLSPARKRYKIKTSCGELSAAELTYAVERTNELMNNCILQYQVRQIDIDKFQLRFVLKERYVGWQEAIQNVFINSLFSPELKKANWEFIRLDNMLPNVKTGKLAYFICDM